ncbi:MAG: ATP-grasp ribosomal peptide maturase [Pseudonocardiales bacterium]|nr:ATP-grasp ribosomal peptide maturase [Pseudonocardiales bacterium]
MLVLTQCFDPTADLVICELSSRRVPVVRLDVAEFPETLVLQARIGGGRNGWHGLLSTDHHTVCLADIRSVWYRRPTRFVLHPAMPTSDRAWTEREALAGFGGVLSALRCRWVNHPHCNAIAESKPLQLATAVACGLAIPDTFITNDPKAARAFVTAQKDGAIYKPLRGSPDGAERKAVALYTSPVTAEEITDGVARTAHLFQSRVPKKFEVRLIVVGQQQFAARIDASSDKTRVDWRSDYGSLTYQPATVPRPISDGVNQLMTSLGLAYGALEFIVDPEGCWYFLEVSPNGQWGWIELATDLPIAHAIADLLEGWTP